MPYAVLQTELDPPNIEQLKRAFAHVPGLTATDAFILGKDAFGVLVKNFSSAQAVAMQGALRTEGIETEIVDQGFLPELPPAKQLNRLDCLPEHLLLYDPIGRSFALPWEHVMFVAAGQVRVSEFLRERTERPVVRYTAAGDFYPDTEIDYSSREKQAFRLLAEIIVAGGALRYSIAAERFNFTYLGARRKKEVVENFAELVRDLAQYATNSAFNRGAECLRNNEVFAYPTKNAFYEEIVWTLWQMKKQQV